MKKAILILFSIALAFSVNAQVWISGETLQPAMFDTINNVTGLKDHVTDKYIVLKLAPRWNTDSVKVGVCYADSVLVTITNYTNRSSFNLNQTGIANHNGYEYINDDKEKVLFWIENVYNNVLKTPTLESMKNNYVPHY